MVQTIFKAGTGLVFQNRERGFTLFVDSGLKGPYAFYESGTFPPYASPRSRHL